MNKYGIVDFGTSHNNLALIKISDIIFNINGRLFVSIDKFILISNSALEKVKIKNDKWKWRGAPTPFKNVKWVSENLIIELEDDETAKLWYELNK